MEYDHFLELIKRRRTIRRFKPDPVPDEYIEKILEAARWAPSGYNLQPWEFIVIKDTKIKAAIMQALEEYRKLIIKTEYFREPWQRIPEAPYRDPEMDFHSAPVFILLIGDTRTQVGFPMVIRTDMERKQTIYTSSLANAYLYMSLAATTLGLANEWVSSIATPYPQTMLKHLLGIPSYFEVYDMMALGCGSVRPRPRMIRNLSEMTHYDYCGESDFRTEGQIKDFIKRARIWAMASIRRGRDS